MEKKSKYNESKIFLDKLDASREILSNKYYNILRNFFFCYEKAIERKALDSNYISLFCIFLDLVIKEITHPYKFQPYHKKIRSPFDYYRFGIDFLRPLVNEKKSSTHGLENVKKMVELLEKNENVIMLANHQIESDPQAISLLLEKSYPQFVEKIIFVAGERVISDPLAIPLSMGCDLLCIYSKKHISEDPKLKINQQLHNRKTMDLMRQLLSEGGKVIYVAPSGGRDRPNKNGIIEIAPFDYQSLEMFYLMAKRAKRPTHFFPLALATHDLLPPPKDIEKEMGEVRTTQHAAIHLSFGKEIDMENFPGSNVTNKIEIRKNRANYIWNLVNIDYQKINN